MPRAIKQWRKESKCAVERLVKKIDSEVECHWDFDDSRESFRVILIKNGKRSGEICGTWKEAKWRPHDLYEDLENRLRSAIDSIQ